MQNVPLHSNFRYSNSLKWTKTMQVNTKSTPPLNGSHVLQHKSVYFYTY